MKMLKKLIFLPIMILLSSCFEQTQQIYEPEEVDIEVERSYSEVKDFELTWESMFDVNRSTYYVYFYSVTCEHCKELKNYIVEKALEREDIYFVKGSSTDQITTDPTKSNNAGNPGDIWILGYPSLIKIVEQKCVKNLAGINQIKGELK